MSRGNGVKVDDKYKKGNRLFLRRCPCDSEVTLMKSMKFFWTDIRQSFIGVTLDSSKT